MFCVCPSFSPGSHFNESAVSVCVDDLQFVFSRPGSAPLIIGWTELSFILLQFYAFILTLENPRNYLF